MLTRNVGKMDRTARVVLGLALIAGFFVNRDAEFSWIYLVGGAVGLITGAMGSCTVYSLLGINSCRAK